jgi:hypothetical protein
MTERSEAAALLFSALLFLAYSGVKLRERERDRWTIGRDTGKERRKEERKERERSNKIGREREREGGKHSEDDTKKERELCGWQ